MIRYLVSACAILYLCACKSTPTHTFQDYSATQHGAIAAINDVLSKPGRSNLVIVQNFGDPQHYSTLWVLSDPQRLRFEGEKVCYSVDGARCQYHAPGRYMRIAFSNEGQFEIVPFTAQSLKRAQDAGKWLPIELRDSSFKNLSHVVTEVTEISDTGICAIAGQAGVHEPKCFAFEEMSTFRVSERQKPDSSLLRGSKAGVNLAATGGLLMLFGAAALASPDF